MSKRKTLRMIRTELQSLNAAIDRKIIKGLPYKRDAIRHKELIALKRRLEWRAGRSNVSRLFTLFQEEYHVRTL